MPKEDPVSKVAADARRCRRCFGGNAAAWRKWGVEDSPPCGACGRRDRPVRRPRPTQGQPEATGARSMTEDGARPTTGGRVAPRRWR